MAAAGVVPLEDEPHAGKSAHAAAPAKRNGAAKEQSKMRIPRSLAVTRFRSIGY